MINNINYRKIHFAVMAIEASAKRHILQAKRCMNA